MQSYRITCLTCNAALKVPDASLVGQILNCPKCHSMVLVTPPPESIVAAASGILATGSAIGPVAAHPVAAAQEPRPVVGGISSGSPPAANFAAAESTRGPSAATAPPVANAPAQATPVLPAPAPPTNGLPEPGRARAATGPNGSTVPAGPAAPMVRAMDDAVTHSPLAPPAAIGLAAAPADSATTADSGRQSRIAAAVAAVTPVIARLPRAWRKWLPLAASGAAGVLLTVGLWMLISRVTAAPAPAAQNPSGAAVLPVVKDSAPAVQQHLKIEMPQHARQADDRKPGPARVTATKVADSKAADNVAAGLASKQAPAPPGTSHSGLPSGQSDSSAAAAKPGPNTPPGISPSPSGTDPKSAPAATISSASSSASSSVSARNAAGGPPVVASRQADLASPGKTADPTRAAPARPVSESTAPRPLPAGSPGLIARLAMPLAEVSLPPTRLETLLSMLGQLGGVPIHYDALALSRVGAAKRDLLSLDAAHGSLGEVLEQALAAKGLDYLATGDYVVVTLPPPEHARLKRVRYSVGDLAGDAASLERLGTLVREVVLPESWDSRGGRGTLEAAGGALLVSQTVEAHWQILVLCERLRVARGISLRSRVDPAQFAPGSRRDKIEEALAREVTLHSGEGAKLSDLVAQLARQSQLEMDLDELALARAGLSPAAAAGLDVEGVPVSKALDELLTPLGLTYRILGGRLLSITTPAASEATLELELYPLGQTAKEAGAGEALATRVTRDVVPRSWQSAGGRGVARFDAASGCLLVWQSPVVQAEVEATLGRWGAR